ncbi:MAG: site-2 protease family protein [Bacteroidota bacterium]
MEPISTRQIIWRSIFFILTLITTTIAGAQLMFGDIFTEKGELLPFEKILQGLHFSLPLLAVLTVHEFGHFFTARYYKLDVSLPLYIPFPNFIGTAGAFIRLNTAPHSRKEYFDVGVAGPVAGFVAALILLFYAFTHLPPPEYIYTIHPEYAAFGPDFAAHAYPGKSVIALNGGLLFNFFAEYVAPAGSMPHPYELMHYPYVVAGFIGLLITGMNLLPIGQLDGGHVVYGLLGNARHRIVAPVAMVLIVLWAGLGVAQPLDLHRMNDAFFNTLWQDTVYLAVLYFTFRKITPSLQTNLLIALSVFTIQYSVALALPAWHGYSAWLLFMLLLGVLLGVYHPKALYDQPLDTGRKAVGWFAIAIFIVCVTPAPIDPFNLDDKGNRVDPGIFGPAEQQQSEPVAKPGNVQAAMPFGNGQNTGIYLIRSNAYNKAAIKNIKNPDII